MSDAMTSAPEGESWAPGAAEPGAVESAYEYRWALRQGILSLPGSPTGEARNQPDAAGYDALRSPTEPRRGSMRLSPSGGPQQPQTPAPVDPGPPQMGPEMPDRGGASGALDMVMNTLLAAQQGVTETGLESAQPITLPEVQRILNAPDDGDPVDMPSRLRAIAGIARENGIEPAFRIGPLGKLEVVARTPDMEPPGGGLGRIADAMGRLLGLGMVDPLAGAVAMGARGAGKASKAVEVTVR